MEADPWADSQRCWKAAMETRRNSAMFAEILPRLNKGQQESEITNIIHEMVEVASLFLDCADLILAFPGRLRYAFVYLDQLVLPSIMQTNRNLYTELGDRVFLYKESSVYKWDRLIATMRLGHTSLESRFVAYKCFLTQIVYLLSKPSKLEPTSLNEKTKKLMGLLAWQGFPYEGKKLLAPHPSTIKIEQYDGYHWAQKLFPYEKKMIKLPQNPLKQSQCFDPGDPQAAIEIPDCATVLYRMSFSSNLLSVVIYMDPSKKNRARMWCRWRGKDNEAKYASRGLYELRVNRSGSSLIFEGYNDRKNKPEKWLVLCFKNWEEMVLLHDSFAALKARSPDTVECDPEELKLGKENLLFKGAIIDNDKDHVVTLYRDIACGGARIAARQRSGKFKRSPVWTAFLGPQQLKKENARRKTNDVVVISKLDIYVTTPRYDVELQESGKSGFLIEFEAPQKAEDFMKAWRRLVKDYESN